MFSKFVHLFWDYFGYSLSVAISFNKAVRILFYFILFILFLRPYFNGDFVESADQFEVYCHSNNYAFQSMKVNVFVLISFYLDLLQLISAIV